MADDCQNARLELIATDKIEDHPGNPRLVFRTDVINGIVANLGDTWPQIHALLVRPHSDVFQLASGHHRIRAARKKGIEKVWCWVQDMTDEQIYMLLAAENNQGELYPLEIGRHALHCETLAKGGRGKKGGLSAYAERVGKTHQYVTQVRMAAEVLEYTNPQVDLQVFLTKSQHLSLIHKLPREGWQGCVEYLGTNELSAADVNGRVEEARKCWDAGGIDDNWEEYLPPVDCTVAVFCGTKIAALDRLADLAQRVGDALLERGHIDLQIEWCKWLVENRGGESWDISRAQAKRIELEEKAYEIEHAKDNGGEADVFEVILADPPWKYDFAETDSRQIENQYPTASVEDIIAHIRAPWAPKIAKDSVLFLWATAPKLREALQVMEGWGFTYKTHAVWDKEKIGMGYWFRGQHELLLVGTCGDMSPPDADKRVSSVFREARDNKHSKKPTCVYEAIENMFPGRSKYEFYQREPVQGWSGGGNECRSARLSEVVGDVA